MYLQPLQIRRKPFRVLTITSISLILFLATLLLGALPARAASTGSQFFPETGYTVSGEFLNYWQSHGGLAIFGYPITPTHYEKDPISGQTYLTQWFERNRFELHPENAGTPYEVELGLLGTQSTANRRGEQPFLPVAASANTADRLYFSQTGHTLSYGFKDYWEANGGLAIFGYPLSEEFQERTPQGTFTVQYFERNRFEFHPEKQPPYSVELGLLGTQVKMPEITPIVSDRLSPEGLLVSYYNAINRNEFLRAYSYWTAPGTGPTSTPPDYTTFVTGYTNTASVGLSVGNIVTEGAAGTSYSRVAAVLISTQKNGAIQRYYGCYLLKQVNVVVDNVPPPHPITIVNAHIFSALQNTSTATLLSRANQSVSNGTCNQ